MQGGKIDVPDLGKFGPEGSFSREEVQLANRNRGMPLEALRYPITPTGLHYLLTHFDIPYIDATSWNLSIDGLVSNPTTLTLDDVKAMPRVTTAVTMECAGNGRALMSPRAVSQPWHLEAIGTAEWTGTPLKGVLREAGIRNTAVEVLFTGLDRGLEAGEFSYYQRSLSIEEASRDEALLAYEMNGSPLEPQHGHPLRLVVPGWYGMTSVKWLGSIEAIGEPFNGFQMASYRYRTAEDDEGEPVSLIRVKALMVPPGVPDFLTRVRALEPGDVELVGMAWAGRNAVTRVEVSVDGGSSWSDAELGEPVSRFAWTPWSFTWQATAGRHSLKVRAADSVGNVQPTKQPWNMQGMGNNMAQNVAVQVTEQ